MVVLVTLVEVVKLYVDRIQIVNVSRLGGREGEIANYGGLGEVAQKLRGWKICGR